MYHQILISYLANARRRGFRSCHLWSCPPQRGDAYIFHRHPPTQRTPSKDRLRAWYDTMLVQAKEQGVVQKFEELYDVYFEENGEYKKDVPLLPFFAGDFWSGEAEKTLYDLNRPRPKSKSKKSKDKQKASGSYLNAQPANGKPTGPRTSPRARTRSISDAVSPARSAATPRMIAGRPSQIILSPSTYGRQDSNGTPNGLPVSQIKLSGKGKGFASQPKPGSHHQPKPATGAASTTKSQAAAGSENPSSSMPLATMVSRLKEMRKEFLYITLAPLTEDEEAALAANSTNSNSNGRTRDSPNASTSASASDDAVMTDVVSESGTADNGSAAMDADGDEQSGDAADQEAAPQGDDDDGDKSMSSPKTATTAASEAGDDADRSVEFFDQRTGFLRMCQSNNFQVRCRGECAA